MEMHVNITVTQNGRRAPQFDLNGRDLNGSLSLAELIAYTKQVLLVTTDTVLKEEQALGFDKKPVFIVDGSASKNVFNVNPFGKIEIIARVDLNDVVLATYQGILDRSPVLHGVYKSSNFVFFKGQQVATDLPSLQAWLASGPDFKDTDNIRFVNIEPYARKLERQGITSNTQGLNQSERGRRGKTRRGNTVLQPNGSYYLTARSIRTKYKRNSIIRFEFISGTQLGITGSFGPKRGKPGRAYLYPSILISVQESGTL